MFPKSSGQNNKPKNTHGQKDSTLETIRDLGSGVVKDTANEFKKIGTGVFDQFFGSYDTDYDNIFEDSSGWNKEKKPPQKNKYEFKLFNYTEYYEKELVKRQIKELTEQIRKEIELLKKADASLLNEVKDIEKISINTLPEKPGIYHIRFLEIVLSILRSLRAKIGESKTWLQAMMTKKKKRGSLFLARSKKQGTQYSLSQELQTARSIQ